MSTMHETSDEKLLDLLRKSGPMSVAEIASATGVTATAVRQRLTRLMSQDYVGRDVARSGRGRPSHRYSLTGKARRQIGSNFADLAMVLWNEIRSVESPEIRRGLFARISQRMADMYQGEVDGSTTAARMDSLKELLDDRHVPFEVERDGELPVLTAVDCPYPDLADEDRGICAVERMLFSKLLDQPLRLAECRLDGHSCCRFEPA